MQALMGKVYRKKTLAMTVGADWAVEPNQLLHPGCRCHLPAPWLLWSLATCVHRYPRPRVLLCSVLEYDAAPKGRDKVGLRALWGTRPRGVQWQDGWLVRSGGFCCAHPFWSGSPGRLGLSRAPKGSHQSLTIRSLLLAFRTDQHAVARA